MVLPTNAFSASRGPATLAVVATMAIACTTPPTPQRGTPVETRTAQPTAPDNRLARPAEERHTPLPARAPALGARLHTTRLPAASFTADTAGLDAVLQWLSTAADLPMVQSPAARALIADTGAALDVDLRAGVTAADFLDLITARVDGLRWRVRHGAVSIETAAEGRRDAVLQSHDVRDLLFARTEFLPPVIQGLPSDDGVPRAGGERESAAAYEPDVLVELVRTITGPEVWSEDGARIDATESGYLLVLAPKALQRRVADALHRMR